MPQPSVDSINSWDIDEYSIATLVRCHNELCLLTRANNQVYASTPIETVAKIMFVD